MGDDDTGTIGTIGRPAMVLKYGNVSHAYLSNEPIRKRSCLARALCLRVEFHI